MSEELSAISKIAPAPAAQSDYDSICAALMDTERGRWFLQEFALRNRSADTKLLLAAIERIEAVVCAERNKQAQQGFRTDLLEMAQAITRTRAEVAEIGSDTAARPESARPDGESSPVPGPPQPRDVFAAAERIRDVTWAMRGHGFDPSTCDQLEELAASILSASSLRDPTDHRASKLSQVLQYLECRIDTLLESCADGEASASEPTPKPKNGFASPFVAEDREPNGVEAKAAPASPLSQQIKFHDAPVAARDDTEGHAAASEHRDPPPDSDPPTSVAELRPAPPEGTDNGSEPTIPAQNHKDGAQTSDDAAQSSQLVVEGVEPIAPFAGHAAVSALAARNGAEPSTAVAAPDDLAAGAVRAAGTPPRDALGAFLPTVELPGSRVLPKSPEVQAASAAVREAAARAFLPEIEMRAEMPGFNAARMGGMPPAASIPPQGHLAMPGPDRGPLAPDQRTPATSQPAAVQASQVGATPAEPPLAAAPLPGSDPLAALKAMSGDELIALFS
jgi:hypothetical protein